MLNQKLQEISVIKGHVIEGVKTTDDYVEIETRSGISFLIELSDEGPQNDSHASFEKVEISNLIGKNITEAYEESYDSSHAVLILKAGKKQGSIKIVHDHNGYYSFSYHLRELI